MAGGSLGRKMTCNYVKQLTFSSSIKLIQTKVFFHIATWKFKKYFDIQIKRYTRKKSMHSLPFLKAI